VDNPSKNKPKISPLPDNQGVGFTSYEPYPETKHKYVLDGRYHNYFVTVDSWKWPEKETKFQPAVIDAFSPNVNKDLHVGHLRNLVLARSFLGLYPTTKYVAMLGYSLGEKDGARKNLDEWFDFVGYHPAIYRDIDLELDDSELIPGEGEYAGCMVWKGPKGPVLMKRSMSHETRPGEKTYAYHDLAFSKIANPFLVLTGAEQKSHFDELGLGERHIAMGLVLDPKTGQKMKSRDGNALSAQDALQLVIDSLDKTSKPKELAWNILVYNFLVVGREQNVKFSIKHWITPKSPGMYISYTAARINKALNKAGYNASSKDLLEKDVQLMGYSEYFHYFLDISRRRVDPSSLANFAYYLAKRLTQAYNDEKIVNGREGFIFAVKYAYDILVNIMNILGMFVLDEV
jgi:arginyl-tRNA synthetase